MDEPRITDTPTIESVLSELSDQGEVTASVVVRAILGRHPQYGSRTGREVNSGTWPELEQRQTAQQWLEAVRSMFDPTLVDRLHGRLAILGLCRLDPDLGNYLRSFAAELQKELIEDFDSILLAQYAGEQRFRRDFLKLLQNRAKLLPEPDADFPPRSQGFLAVTRGGRNLDTLTRLCFRQSYNACLTAHFGLSSRDTWQSFEQQLLTDLGGIAAGNYGTVGTFLPELGVNLRPGTSQRSWPQVVVTSPSTSSAQQQQVPATPASLRELLEHWGSAGLRTGQRLVLFIEWRGLTEGALPSSIGLSDDVLALFDSLPERVGIVISGLPESVIREIATSELRVLELPADETPMLSQALLNDTPAGPDRLQILDEVEALADAIALKEMHPPLVVGVLGGWGTGKSFVLHLIAERLKQLRCQSVAEGNRNYPFVGHPYLIRFDAWTFAKSNLWASLMQTTLVELDRQLSLEHELARTLHLDLRDGSDVWRLLGELTDKQRDRLLKTDLGVEALEAASRFAQRGSPGRLWNELETLRKVEKDQLASEETTLRELRAEQANAQRDLETEVERELSADARRVAWMPVWQEVAALVRNKFDESDAPTFDQVVESVSIVRRFWLGINNLSLPAAAFMAIAIAGGFILGYVDPVIDWWAKAAGLLAAAVTPVVRAWDWFEARRAAYESRLAVAQAGHEHKRDERLAERIRIAQPGSAGEKVAELGARVDDTEARVHRIRARLGVTGHSRSLNDFLKSRIEEGLYQKELGILDQIQGDIQELSDTLVPSRAKGSVDAERLQALFPRGDPRVVLLIDDLDRCPPDKVVEVFEAAQLLVKTRLFVVVLAMDVRYVTRALEAQYKDVLVRSGEPSGLDYIEKIIQIPYRVRTVSAPAIRTFLRSQMEIVEPDEHGKPAAEEAASSGSTPGEGETAHEQAEKARLSASAGPPRLETTDLPPQVIQFEPDEYAAISEACSALAVSPRTMKRLVNVLKLLKIIWYRQGLQQGPGADVKQAMLSLLALCARYPEVLRKLLADMEAAYRAETRPGDETLVDFLVARCEEGAKSALYPPDWQRVAEAIQHKHFFPEDVTFGRLEEVNLYLLSSFSFVGETDAEREATLQRGFYRNTVDVLERHGESIANDAG